MQLITEGLKYKHEKRILNSEEIDIHIISYEQSINKNLTLLVSKVSEAIAPNVDMNHVGEGASMNEIIKAQKGIRFIINGGFSHYRKDFYEWKHQSFNVGDPVGIVKIRNHSFEDFINIENYGFLVQKEKGQNWNIENSQNINKNEKYILGCTPLLIFDKNKVILPTETMNPMPEGKINPPSILGHGLQNHPRTAVGKINNELIFITVSNCTLLDLQQIGFEMNLDSMLNLDGGGSSQFRIIKDNDFIKNKVSKDDESRILGHTLIIFDETLK